MKRICCAALTAFLFISACNRDPQAQAQKYFSQGNRLLASGKVAEAAIFYRRSIAHAPRMGIAYLKLAECELQRKNPSAAVRSLYRAYELQDGSYDAYTPLAELILDVYRNDPVGAKNAKDSLEELNARELRRNPQSKVLPRVQGEMLLIEGKPSEAVQKLEEAARHRPEDRRALALLFRALVESRQEKAAEQLAQRVLREHNDFLDLHEGYCRLLESQRRWVDLEAQRKRQIAGSPGELAPRLALARLYQLRNRPADAEAVLEEVLKSHDRFPAARLRVGEYYARYLSLDRAISIFFEGAEREPDRAEQYREKIIEAYLQRGQVAQAYRMVEDLLRQYPDSATALAVRGSIRLLQNPQQGLADLRAAVAKEPGSPTLRLALGEAERRLGDRRQARVHLQEALRRMPTSPLPKLSLASLHLDQQEYGDALALAEDVLKLYPNNPNAKQIRAAVMIASKRMAEARAEIQALLQSDPYHISNLLLAAQLELAEGKYAKAEKAFRDLYQVAPGDDRAIQGITKCLLATHRTQEAIRFLEQQLKIRPENADLRYGLAELHLQSRDYSQAAVHLKAILQRNPRDPGAWAALGRVYYHSREFPSAEEALRKALSLQPDHLSGNLHLGTLLAESKRYREAKPLLERVLDKDSHQPVALNNLACILAESGEDLGRALSLAERAVAAEPGNPNYRDTLGFIYLRRKMTTEATRLYRELIRQEPARALWRIRLAEALLQGGQLPAARAELEAALRLRPAEAERQEIQGLLRRAGS